MAKKIWVMRVEGTGKNRRCYVRLMTPAGAREVEISPAVENAMKELQREFDKYDMREYRHESHLEQTPTTKIPRDLFGKSPEELMMERYESNRLKDALLRLSLVQRRRFILKYDYKLPTEEIARIEGCSTRAIERSLTNARRKLRKLLEM